MTAAAAPDSRVALSVRKDGRKGWVVELVRHGVEFYDGEGHATISVAPVTHPADPGAPYCFHEALDIVRYLVRQGTARYNRELSFLRPRTKVTVHCRCRARCWYQDKVCAGCYALVTGNAC